MKFDRLDCSVNRFIRRISVLAITIAILASSLVRAPDAQATLMPIAIDDIQIFVPCADFSGNAGVAGASVSVANKTTITDGNGNYLIRCIKAGSYSISASKSGYSFNPAAIPVVVAPGSHATIVNNFVASVVQPPSVTYYFSDCQAGAHAACVTGNNANAGTSASAPKQTLAGVNLNTLPAGALLLFARGGDWANFTTNQADQLENLNVTPAQPMVFDAYTPSWGGTAAPWLKTASGIAVELGGYNNVANDGGYTFRNLKFDGLQSGTWGFWLRDNLRYVTIENVEITGFGIAIHSQGTAPSYVNHFTLRNSNIHHNYDMGILGKFMDSVIEGTIFESNNFSGSAFSHAIYFSGGDDNIIRNNTFTNNSVANGTCNGGNVTFHGQSNGMLVENNTITQVASTGGCYGFSITSGYTSPEWFRNYIVRGNTIVNLGYLAIAVHAAPGIVIENNIIRNSQTGLQYAVSVGASDGVGAAGDDVATDAIVRNNVVCYSQPNANSRAVVIIAPATGTETGTIYRTGADASTGACASVGSPAAALQAGLSQ